MAKPKQQIFNVQFNVNVLTTIDIYASSMEEALQKANGYEVKDVVDFDTYFIDGSIDVTGVFK